MYFPKVNRLVTMPEDKFGASLASRKEQTLTASLMSVLLKAVVVPTLTHVKVLSLTATYAPTLVSWKVLQISARSHLIVLFTRTSRCDQKEWLQILQSS